MAVTIDITHIGKVLQLEAAIVEAATKHNLIGTDGALVGSNLADLSGCATDVIAVLEGAGVPLDPQIQTWLRKAPALLTLIA